MHLLANSNGQGGSSQHNSGGSQDVVVKSSSDVKVFSNHLLFNGKCYYATDFSIKCFVDRHSRTAT